MPLKYYNTTFWATIIPQYGICSAKKKSHANFQQCLESTSSLLWWGERRFIPMWDNWTQPNRRTFFLFLLVSGATHTLHFFCRTCHIVSACSFCKCTYQSPFARARTAPRWFSTQNTDEHTRIVRKRTRVPPPHPIPPPKKSTGCAQTRKKRAEATSLS